MTQTDKEVVQALFTAMKLAFNAENWADVERIEKLIRMVMKGERNVVSQV